jgi:FAD/FMN-containing dehydrogenase
MLRAPRYAEASIVQDSFMSVIAERLAAIVGREHCITDPELLSSYTTDWTGRFGGPALCVVRPASTEQVADVMRACAAAGTPVLVQGGNTGLVGGSVPGPDDPSPPVIVSTTRLDWMEPVDHLSGQVTVGAGVRLAELHRHGVAAGWRYGVDVAARDSATVGGTIATNAGGIHVISQGMTRAQVMGIEAVLPNGSVMTHLAGLPKDNTGFDLAGLLCGSEGTLGIITAARLRLHPPLPASTVAYVGVESLDDAIALVNAHRAGTEQVVAAEVLDATCMDLAVEFTGQSWPLERRYPWLVLLEIADGGDASGLRLDGHDDVAVGVEKTDQVRLWSLRERQSDAFAALGVVQHFDVAIPPRAMSACVAELRQLLAEYPEVRTYGFFGHIGDTNMHLLVHGPDPQGHALDAAVLAVVARHQGSISAEHGIGRAKVAELSLCRSPAEIEAMRAIKRAWDPDGLMNPGVIFPSA